MNPTTDDLGATFSQLRSSLRGYLCRRISDPTQVDDLLQDVFVKALASQQAGRRIENLTGWLYTATRTTLADYYRVTGTQMISLDDDMPEYVADTQEDNLLLHQELSTCLQAFVEQLAPMYRDTIIATDLRGETMSSLAQAQGVSVSAIKSRAARGRVMLKKKLLACCDVEIAGGFVSDYQQRSSFSCNSECT